eukprot:CAMPEP_0206294054 /NCGR_PEP_ID=MMETSP0106_2-20121207/4456_1 /ASSEMBLY_ACC=CAM_ASM_000206 /TAXON_ID=81532 /ORGANISM="Acanthoeca-like sp., Strain 10tr" /LENGTH=37 /DNA_ID= /DNA_START= /DNA_END= /DNA_ORIENTATION=
MALTATAVGTPSIDVLAVSPGSASSSATGCSSSTAAA